MRRKQYLIVGAGRFGTALATTLFEEGHEVVLVDTNKEAIEDAMNDVTQAIVADATEERAMRQLGASNFDAVVVAISSDFEANILATVAAKAAGAKRVIVKAGNQVMARVLGAVGADEVVRPEHDMGVRLAGRLTAPSIVDTFGLGPNHSVVEVENKDRLEGRLSKLRLSNRFGVQVIAVHRKGEVVVSPGADFEVQHGDRIVVIGPNVALQKLKEFLGE